MKVRLLKKIRRQYVITYYPDGGFDLQGKYTRKELLKLHNRYNEFFCYSVTIGTINFPYYTDALDYLKELLLKDVRSKWSGKIKSKKITKNKVWFNQ